MSSMHNGLPILKPSLHQLASFALRLVELKPTSLEAQPFAPTFRSLLWSSSNYLCCLRAGWLAGIPIKPLEVDDSGIARRRSHMRNMCRRMQMYCQE